LTDFAAGACSNSPCIVTQSDLTGRKNSFNPKPTGLNESLAAANMPDFRAKP
jgi:hypothetical protein